MAALLYVQADNPVLIEEWKESLSDLYPLTVPLTASIMLLVYPVDFVIAEVIAVVTPSSILLFVVADDQYVALTVPLTALILLRSSESAFSKSDLRVAAAAVV